jgi:hypothetical protein
MNDAHIYKYFIYAHLLYYICNSNNNKDVRVLFSF